MGAPGQGPLEARAALDDAAHGLLHRLGRVFPVVVTVERLEMLLVGVPQPQPRKPQKHVEERHFPGLKGLIRFREKNFEKIKWLLEFVLYIFHIRLPSAVWPWEQRLGSKRSIKESRSFSSQNPFFPTSSVSKFDAWMKQNTSNRLQQITQGASIFVLLYEGVCLLIFWGQDDYILGSREVALFAACFEEQQFNRFL